MPGTFTTTSDRAPNRENASDGVFDLHTVAVLAIVLLIVVRLVL